MLGRISTNPSFFSYNPPKTDDDNESRIAISHSKDIEFSCVRFDQHEMFSVTFVTITQLINMYNTISRLSASGGSPTVAAGLAGSQGPSSPTLPPGKEEI